MKPDKSITITDASIKQVSIEVKVIKIDNKQMTLAVFKQILHEKIIDDRTGRLKGKPWGKVEYHTNCGIWKRSEHIHVIWQKGNELRQCIVPLVSNTKGIPPYDKLEALDQLFIAV